VEFVPASSRLQEAFGALANPTPHVLDYFLNKQDIFFLPDASTPTMNRKDFG